VLVASVILTLGLVSMAQLLGVTTVMHTDAKEASMATQLAQAKIDELIKLNMATAPAVQISGTGTLTTNTANYFDTPQEGITRRWRVQAGPAANIRVLTVRIVNVRARHYGNQVELTTLLRQW
jgi:Tfp pilus assembly protein PilV